MNDEQELDLRLRAAFAAGHLPPAPSSLHDALEAIVDLPFVSDTRPRGRLGILRALAVAAVVAFGGAIALSVGSGRFDASPSVAVATPSLAPGESPLSIRRLVFQPQWTGSIPATADRLDAIVDTVRARLDAMGLEPVVASDDNGNVLVEVADHADLDTVRRVASQVGYVEFVPLGDRSAVAGEQLSDAEHPALFDGEAVTSARMSEDQSGLPSVQINLRDAEAAEFATFTENSIGSLLAVTIDRVVVLAPSISEAIHGGEISISPADADTERLAEAVAIIDNGPLPVPLVEVAAETPTASPFGYDLICGPMERSACEARAASMVEAATQEYPGRVVVRVQFTGGDGDGDVIFSDGSVVGVDIN